MLNTILLIGSIDPCGESDEFSSPVQCLLLFIEYEEQLKVITRVSSALSLSLTPPHPVCLCPLSLLMIPIILLLLFWELTKKNYVRQGVPRREFLLDYARAARHKEQEPFFE